jgi:type IV fimbrial biogenesis protein FimT
MKQSGTTLLELLVVLAIAAILLAIGIPSFASLASSNHLTSATNSMVASLHLARSEAIKRNSRTVLCPSASGTACAVSGGWQQGWLVFHDGNNNAALDAGEAVILSQAGMPDGFRLTGNLHVSSYISYTPIGATRTLSGLYQLGTLTVCEVSGSPVSAREIKISSTGRPRTTKVTLASCPS